jgi:muconolactone delta-isomerase
MPPDAVPGLVDAMLGWIEGYTAKGKLESVWHFAGKQGGGGIATVDSLEELNAMMTEFPFGPFSKIDVIPLSDVKEGLLQLKEVVKKMA